MVTDDTVAVAEDLDEHAPGGQPGVSSLASSGRAASTAETLSSAAADLSTSDASLGRMLDEDIGSVIDGNPDVLLGEIIEGRYRILDRIGQGGMGVVYRAEHIKLKKEMALKVLTQHRSDLLERFRLEAEAACAIHHPHIIDVTDFGNLPDGRPFYVMELLKGRSLKSVIKDEAPLELKRVLRMGAQLCDALGAVHEKGFIHRDVKPDNIFVIEQEGEFTKLLDFGITKLMDLRPTKLTDSGIFIGTPQYLSPEQAGGAAVDFRTDIYSLGMVLYEMVTGRSAIEGDNILNILQVLANGAWPSPREVAPNSPAAQVLEGVILRSTAKDPCDRFASMSAFKNALKSAILPLDIALTPTPPPEFGQSGRQPSQRPALALTETIEPGSSRPVAIVNQRRRGWRMMLLGGLCLAVLAGGTLWWSELLPSNRAVKHSGPDRESSPILAAPRMMQPPLPDVSEVQVHAVRKQANAHSEDAVSSTAVKEHASQDAESYGDTHGLDDRGVEEHPPAPMKPAALRPRRIRWASTVHRGVEGKRRNGSSRVLGKKGVFKFPD